MPFMYNIIAKDMRGKEYIATPKNQKFSTYPNVIREAKSSLQAARSQNKGRGLMFHAEIRKDNKVYDMIPKHTVYR